MNMSWFEHQIKTRAKTDDMLFSESNRALADVILGEEGAVYDDVESAEDDIGRMLRYFHITPQPLPENLHDLNDQLEYLLRPSGIMRRGVCLEKGWHRDAALPMLLFRRDTRQPVIVIPDRLGRYFFYSRKDGKKAYVRAADEETFDADAIVFYRPLPLRSLSLQDVLRFNLQSHTRLERVLLVLFLSLATLIQLTLPRITKSVFSSAIPSGRMQLLWALAVLLLSMGVSSVLFASLKNQVLARINNRCSTSFEAAMVMRLLSLPTDFFRKKGAGELYCQMLHCGQICPQMNNMFYSSLLGALFSLVYVVQLFRFAPAVAPAAITVILLQILLIVGTGFMAYRIKQTQLPLENAESDLAFYMLHGIQKIRLVGAEKRAYARWAAAFADYARSLYRLPLLLVMGPVLVTAVSMIGQIVIFTLSLQSGISVPDYYAFNTAYGLAAGAILSLSSLSDAMAEIRPMYAQLQSILEEEPELSPAKEIVSDLKGKIELEDVCFRYDPGMPNVIDHLNLTVNPGEYLAIVGRTGCGKSTILRLMLGFEKPDSGIVTFDGTDLNALDLHSLRRKIGVVLQDGKLFKGDIYSNIVISAPWLTEDEAWEAARLAGLEEDIRQMPMGMHTMINGNSGGVSGGQRQRIMIARAIAGRPRILMFDEATSALDNVTQKIVSDSLSQLNCTRIVIAHRLSTIRQCDRIIMMDGGHIVESGTYDELIANGGAFADMVARQQVSFNDE